MKSAERLRRFHEEVLNLREIAGFAAEFQGYCRLEATMVGTEIGIASTVEIVRHRFLQKMTIVPEETPARA